MRIPSICADGGTRGGGVAPACVRHEAGRQPPHLAKDDPVPIVEAVALGVVREDGRGLAGRDVHDDRRLGLHAQQGHRAQEARVAAQRTQRGRGSWGTQAAGGVCRHTHVLAVEVPHDVLWPEVHERPARRAPHVRSDEADRRGLQPGRAQSDRA